MQFLPITLVVVMTLGLCLGRSQSSMTINEIKQMVLDYEPLEERVEQLGGLNMAARIFQNSVVEYESNNPIDADNIPTLAGKLGLTSLVSSVTKAGLAGVLSGKGPFTVFGPTNEAFDNLPEWAKKAVQNVTILGDVLKYHVIASIVKSGDLSNDLMAPTVLGAKIRINIYTKEETNDKVYTAQCAPIELSKVDQMASNGVIHVLNAVMIPPQGNIVSTVAACPAFKTLVKAVTVANLASTLSGPGPFTLFAPTDRAFAKLPPGTLEKLIKNPTELAKILTYHVVPSTQCSAGLSSGDVKTVEGQNVKVEVSDAGVTVNGAKVISADGSVTNGVVHAIDTVLLPPNFELP